MVKHAILLADKEWCEAASPGRARVYHFIGPRRREIHALGKGSVCVVVTKAKPGQPQIVYGEFTVTDVVEVGASEYNRLAMEGLIYEPETLGPGERRWVIFFDEFREYGVKPRKDELTDVKTSTSKKPISEWAIIGLTYIDDQALEGIRRKAGGPRPPITRIDELEERVSRLEELMGVSELALPITHECAELMLLSIGRQLGFKVYTADHSKSCGSTSLFINLVFYTTVCWYLYEHRLTSSNAFSPGPILSRTLITSTSHTHCKKKKLIVEVKNHFPRTLSSSMGICDGVSATGMPAFSRLNLLDL